MRRFFSKLANLFRSKRAEREMAREIEVHLAILQETYERRGLSASEAAREARLALGGVQQARELHRETRAFAVLDQFFYDVRYACRGLARNPGFTLTAAAALGLGIGANASIFAIFDAFLLKPLPVAHPESVVRLKRWYAHSENGGSSFSFSREEYEYLRGHSASFSALTAVDSGSDDSELGGITVLASIAGNPARENLDGRIVSGNYFDALGIPAQIGRTFRPEEDAATGSGPVLVLTWKRGYFGILASSSTTLCLLALALASVGIYGVMAFLVNRRTREIGIRMTLGATPRRVLRKVMVDGLRPVFAGMAAGVAITLGLEIWGRTSQITDDTLLHSVFADPLLYVGTTVMLAAAALACAFPAMRALRIDPMAALRHE